VGIKAPYILNDEVKIMCIQTWNEEEPPEVMDEASYREMVAKEEAMDYFFYTHPDGENKPCCEGCDHLNKDTGACNHPDYPK